MKKWGQVSILLAVFFVFTNVYVNAETIVADGKALRNVETVNIKGRVLAPFRAILQSLGAKVDWDKPTKTVTATKDDIVIKMVIGNETATVNGKNVTLDVPPQIIKDFTYIPVRFIGEALNMNVTYVKSSKSVYISYKDIQINETLANTNSILEDSEISVVKNGEYCSFVNSDGEEVIMGGYQDAKPFVNGLARVKYNDLWGCINKDGSPVVDMQYTALGIYNEKVMPYMNMDGTFGYVDTRSRIVINAQYDFATQFKNGKALVMKFINSDFTQQLSLEEDYLSMAMEQARQEIEQEETYLPQIDTGEDEFMREMEREQRISQRAFEIQNQYITERIQEELKNNPAYKLQNINNERWMYIDIKGNVIEDNVKITEEQRANLIAEYK